MDHTQHDLNKIKSRSIFSVGSLLTQSSYSAVLGFIAFFILTLRSGIYLLGIYNTVLAMLAFFNYFTDLGLAAAIVQKKDIEDEDLNTAFFIQMGLAIIAVVIGFLLTDKLFTLYKDLPHNAIYLYWSVLVSFFLLSLKTIPSVLLEKRIMIYKVVFVQAIENTLFYAAIIIFSLLKFDIFSLVIAVLVRSVVGTIAIYIMNPWVPKLNFSFKHAKALLRFGIPFQSNSFLALIKDNLLIIYLGSIIGLANLGYVTFAKKYAEFSIRLIMDNINRVAFPLFSRFQKEPDLLKKSLERVMFYESILIFPAIIGLMFTFDSFLKIVPGYFLKWNASIFSFYFFSLSALFISLSTPFINLFNAVGKVKVSLYFMVLWTALIWILVPLGIKFAGYKGISIAFFVMSLTFALVYWYMKKLVHFSERTAFFTSISATCVMTVYLVIVRLIALSYLHNIYLHIGLSIFGGILVYGGIVYVQKGKKVYEELLIMFKPS